MAGLIINALKKKAMKRNKFITKTRHIYLALSVLAVSFLSSCLKDKGPGSVNFGDSPALVSFQYAGFSAVPYVASILGTAQDTTSLEVTLSVSTVTLKSPVTVDIVDDAAGAAKYIANDTAGGKTDHVLPTSQYTIQNGGKVTISPGQSMVHVRINFTGQNIDFTRNNIIGLKLANPSGAQLTTNLNSAIVVVALRSPYAGTYKAVGKRHHPTLGDFPFSYNVVMGTVDKNVILGNALADLAVDLQITINPDNSVTVSSTSDPLQLTSGAVNKYDPATKTFTLNYFYAISGAARVINETLTYVGP